MNLLKSRIIQGTLLLTAAGFITRILGFFYRIFLPTNWELLYSEVIN